MNTRYLLIASSLAMGAAGLAASFAPQELLVFLQVAPTAPLPVILQLTGALYLAFAAANWTAKDSRIGGIYARPLALGNCLHFAMGALALGKYEWNAGFSGPLAAVFGVYLLFALGFGYLIFGGGVACAVSKNEG